MKFFSTLFLAAPLFSSFVSAAVLPRDDAADLIQAPAAQDVSAGQSQYTLVQHFQSCYEGVSPKADHIYKVIGQPTTPVKIEIVHDVKKVLGEIIELIQEVIEVIGVAQYDDSRDHVTLVKIVADLLVLVIELVVFLLDLIFKGLLPDLFSIVLELVRVIELLLQALLALVATLVSDILAIVAVILKDLLHGVNYLVADVLSFVFKLLGLVL